MIDLEHVTKTYQMGTNTYEALRGIDLHVGRGDLAAIIGSSGSGKSTTMNILGLLDKPTSGRYVLAGEDTSHLSSNQLAHLRNRKIGFIFQSFFLLPRLSALHNVGLPMEYANWPAKKIRQRALEMLERVDMKQFAHHKPNELSGGQKQRVAIARALVLEPEIILADEPTGALDSKTSDDVLQLLINQAEGTTVIIITHDPEVAAACPRVIKIYDGLIKE